MGLSLNASFTAPIDSAPNPALPVGGHLADAIRSGLAAQGWGVGEPENWRDSGWSLSCNRGQASLECVLAGGSDGEWMLQVAPAFVPGFIGRVLLKKQPSATAEDVLALAMAVHATVSARPGTVGFRWEWDGPPSEASPTQPRAE